MTRTVATFGMEDAEALRAAREELVDGPITLYLRRLQDILIARGGAYFAADRLTVADLKVYVWILNLRSGVLDHVPKDLVDRVAPELAKHCDRVAGELSSCGRDSRRTETCVRWTSSCWPLCCWSS